MMSSRKCGFAQTSYLFVQNSSLIIVANRCPELLGYGYLMTRMQKASKPNLPRPDIRLDGSALSIRSKLLAGAVMTNRLMGERTSTWSTNRECLRCLPSGLQRTERTGLAPFINVEGVETELLNIGGGLKNEVETSGWDHTGNIVSPLQHMHARMSGTTGSARRADDVKRSDR